MSSENNNDKGNKGNKDGKTKKIFYQIMDKQGFYIILILCLTIVAATAWWVDNQKGDYFIGNVPTIPFEDDEQPEVILVEDDENNGEKAGETKETGKIGEGKSEEDSAEDPAEDPAKDGETSSEDSKEKSGEESSKSSKTTAGKDSKIAQPEGTPVKKDDKIAEPKKTPAKQENKIETTKKTTAGKDGETEKAKETSAPQASKDSELSITENMAVPVAGKLILPFADDCLVYHKTLDQWSTHKGVDIQAAEGTPVKAVLDGEVVEILNDTIMGISIIIKHDNELLTIYSNLSTDSMVEVGEKVKKGRTISAVGKTASTKILEGPLLHFQILKDDKFVDPELYLGEISA